MRILIFRNKYMSCIIIFLTSLFVISCKDTGNSRVKTGLEGKPIPNFTVLALDSIMQINIAKRSANKSYVIFSFAPWCPYCKTQTQELIKNIQSLDNVDIYMLSVSPIQELNAYADKYELKKYKNIILVQDPTYSFISYFNNSAVPYFAIVDSANKLKYVIQGKSSIREIRKAVLGSNL